jgi:hypothetical protein
MYPFIHENLVESLAAIVLTDDAVICEILFSEILLGSLFFTLAEKAAFSAKNIIRQLARITKVAGPASAQTL